MNIFATSSDPTKCAIVIDNKRLPKMLLEACQLMSTNGYGPYKPTHVNHPCSLWVGESSANAQWLAHHCRALHKEILYRFGTIHSSYIKCSKNWDGFLSQPICFSLMTPFKNCTNFKFVEDTHLAYQKHLNQKWNETKPVWYGRDYPSFYHKT